VTLSGSRIVRSALLGVAVLSLAGCQTETVPTSTGAGDVAASASSPRPDAWVAVLGDADEPDELIADRKRVLAALGDVLKGSVVISPASCFEGLPSELDAYLLAIERDSRKDVRALASQQPREPSFIGGVTSLCTD
jgi:hypothetical protein